MRTLALTLVTLLPLAAAVTSSPARADLSGDPDFCYVGWVWQYRYAYTEDAEGRATEVQLSGMIQVCPAG